MRRGLSAIVLLACSSPGAVGSGPPIDAGAQGPELLLTVVSDLTVVHGESVTLEVRVSPNAPNVPPATIGFGPLPLGVSGTSAPWEEGQQAVSLTLTTTPEVPAAPIFVDLRAWTAGQIIGDQAVRVEISDTEGSIDPAFGQNGLARMPNGTILRDIALQPDGGWTVSGVDGSDIFVAHLDANGAIRDTVTNPVPGFGVFAVFDWATSGDGRKAIGIGDGNPNALVIADATGVPTTVLSLSNPPMPIAWAGNDIVFGQTLELEVLLGASTQVPAHIPFAGPTRLCGVSDGSFYVLDAYGDLSHMTSSSSSKTTLPTGIFSGLALDSSGRVLVGATIDTKADFGVLRVLPTGDVDSTFGAAGYAHVSDDFANATVSSILELSGGDILISGSAANIGGVFARFDPSGAVVTSFGSLGHAFLGQQPTAMALDATATHACVADKDTVYCIRLTN